MEPFNQLLEWIRNTQDATLSPSKNSYISPKLQVKEQLGTGRGIYANGGINKREQIIRIPHSFLLNKTSVIRHITKSNKDVVLTDHYLNIFVPPQEDDTFTKFYSTLSLQLLLDLSSFQIISMYLTFESQRNSYWNPFINSLPEISDFALAPLLWKVLEVKSHQQLLDCLPVSTRRRAEKIYHRFVTDYDVVQQFVERAIAESTSRYSSEEKVSPGPITKRTFLWAWLSINSRCLYMDIPLSISKDDNFTMAPYVDFLNHSPNDQCTLKIDSTGFQVITTTPYKDNEQLFLSYGPHSNEFLLCEYGFTLDENKWNELDLTDLIVPLLKPKQIEYLKDNNYFGDYTINQDSELSFRTEVLLAVLQEQTPKESRRLNALLNGTIDSSVYAKNSNILLDAMLQKIIHNCDTKLSLQYSDDPDLETRERIKTIGVLYKNMKSIAESVLLKR